FEQRLVDAHLRDVAREPIFRRPQLPKLVLRQVLSVDGNRQATLVVAADRYLMDADARSGSAFAHGRANQRVDTARSAQPPRRAQFRDQLAAVVFQSIAGRLALLERVAAAWNGPADAGGHAALAHQSADRHAGLDRAAGRMKIDRKLALTQSFEEVAQLLGRL